LLPAGVWMVGSASNPLSIAFVIILSVGAFAMYRLGRAGLIAPMTTYLAARLGMEALRMAMGEATPVAQLIAEVFVVAIAVLILSATVDSYRAEQARAEKALRLGKSLEHLATEIASETEPMAPSRTIAPSPLPPAHASIARRNARIIEQGRRLETLSRELSGAMPEDVIDRIAQAMQAVFNLEWVIISEVKGDLVRSMAALGKAAPARSHGWISHGPLLRQVVAARELVLMRDYASDSGIELDRPISMLARDVGVHATMVAPIILDGEIRAAPTR